jgi:Zn-dependent hydrolases, including glyoxylases
MLSRGRSFGMQGAMRQDERAHLPDNTEWEILAIRYASKSLPAAHILLDPDPHDSEGVLDYFVWICRNGDRVVLVDTGFEREEGARRGRIMKTHPVDALARLGITPEMVTDVFVTHLHYDHAGNLSHFPNAKIHLQDAEMNYATGRCMCHARMRKPFSVADVKTAVEMVYRDRVLFHDGDYTLYPGLRAKLVGGHSRGLQILIADGERPLVIASDAVHLRRYLANDQLFPLFADYEATVEGYRLLRELMADGAEILPGHDPDVLTLYPRVLPDWEDAVRIRP